MSTDPILDSALAAAKRLCEKPWTYIMFDGPSNIHVVEADQIHRRICFMTSDGPTEARATLIAAAPTMAAEIERLRAENENLGQACAELERRADESYRNSLVADLQADVARLRAVNDELVRALTDAVAIIRKYVPADALGTNSQGGGDGWNDQSWPILDEYLHYMDAALAKAKVG